MEASGGTEQPSSLQSICHVRACEVFPKALLETEDECLKTPFMPLPGEAVSYLGRTTDGVLALSNYRMFVQRQDGAHQNVPLGLVETMEVRDIFHLHVFCKDARSLRLTFSTGELCMEWLRRLHTATAPPQSMEEMFAFAFFAWSSEEGSEEALARLGGGSTCHRANEEADVFRSELERLGFDVHCAWRVSTANTDHRLCPSYPRRLLVPACVSDETLEGAARFRSARRLPVVVWRHRGNGAVIARCSQPEVGWLGWRSSEDEDLLKAIADACAFDRGSRTMMEPLPTDCTEYPANVNELSPALGDPVSTSSNSMQHENKKVLIMDARSYTTAVANRARGGGCECQEYYPSCDITFMSLANIHSVRKSFHAVRQLCAAAPDTPNWLSLLEGSRWLHHMAGLMRAAVAVASAVAREGRPVLVHCSDGWDRTPQIVALAELLLDPHYRTIEGFEVLVEREWLSFGHKFGDRCGGQSVGADDPNERCPVFLQWLDCVHQVALQFPTAFEFAPAFLVRLARHTYSRLFGTFLCNSARERAHLRVHERTFSVWAFLRSAPHAFRNHLYTPHEQQQESEARFLSLGQGKDLELCVQSWEEGELCVRMWLRLQVLWPACHVRDLILWSDVYLGLGEAPPPSLAPAPAPGPPQSPQATLTVAPPVPPAGVLGKTRSCDNLLVDLPPPQQRRCSDPSLALDSVLQGLALTEPAAGDVSPRSSASSDGMMSDEDHDEESLTTRADITVAGDSSTDTLVPSTIPPPEVEEPVIRGIGAQSGSSDSRYSTPPPYLRTPSTTATTPPGPCDSMRIGSNMTGLDLDGLAPLRSDVQLRLRQILAEHRAREEALQRELHTTRLALVQQVCHHCNHGGGERPDDAGSLAESVCSGEQPSAGESLPTSDVSWEALEEREAGGGGPTLWVPDHAAARCMGCGTEFWLGRRRHHCRNCGKVFCADCSENALPVPREQLYEPVRVCASCFSLLHHDPRITAAAAPRLMAPVVPDLCKQLAPSPAAAAVVVAAAGVGHKSAAVVTAAST
ncbi:Uncharacterized protein GBIM_07751 [Gryllus bimaculatus]|nr:Uncharacterized protein GBIM_07751 [Gryllus bimaculatus]